MTTFYKLLDLPTEVLDNILSYLSYDEIAKDRVVCKKFNESCGKLLNRGFLNVERQNAALHKKIKGLLPRRESERRVHQLARHSDILTATETRISMLRMSFMKYIEKNLCCFIPGKVLDEIQRILSLVESTCTPPRTHEVLLELRDISSMAMEYFDEKIAPTLKLYNLSSYPIIMPTAQPSGNRVFPINFQGLMVNNFIRRDLFKMKKRTLAHKQHIMMLQKVVTQLTSTVKKQYTLIKSQSAKIQDQSAKIRDQHTSIADLKRHVEEWDSKLQDVSSGLNSCNRDVPLPSVKSTAPVASLLEIPATAPHFFTSNIKPRKAQILPHLDLGKYELERKRKSSSCLSLSASSSAIPSKISRLESYLNGEKKNNTQSFDYDAELSLLNPELRLKVKPKTKPTYSEMVLKRRPSFLIQSLETLLNKTPFTGIQSRKRKLP